MFKKLLKAFYAKTTDEIMSGFNKAIKDLEDSATYFANNAADYKQEMLDVEARMVAAVTESEKARKMASKLSALFN